MSNFRELDKFPKTIFKPSYQQMAVLDPVDVTSAVRPTSTYKSTLIKSIGALKVTIPSLKDMSGLSFNVKQSLNNLDAKLNISNALDKLPGINNTVKQNLSIINDSINSTTTTPVKIANEIFTVVNDNLEMVESLKDIVTVITDPGLIRDLTDNVKLSLVNTAVDIAGNQGMSRLVDILEPIVPDINDNKIRYWGQVLHSFSGSSDLDLLSRAIDNGALNVTSLFSSKPVEHMLSNLKLDLDKYNSLENNMSEIVTLLDKIDPSWDGTMDGPDKIFNLSVFTKANESLSKGFSVMDEYRDVVALSKTIIPKTSNQIIADSYPIMKKLTIA